MTATEEADPPQTDHQTGAAERYQGEIWEGLGEIVARAIPTAFAETTNNDAAASLELIGFTQLLAAEAAQLRDDAVAVARKQQVSWAAIGAELGMSRQAAQQRFGEPAQAPDDQAEYPANAPVGSVWRLSPVTSLNEMKLLNYYGQQGWHSFRFGTLFHDLVKDSQVWEHHRVTFPGSLRLTRDGWERIGSWWFPWAYYARPTGQPVEPREILR